MVKAATLFAAAVVCAKALQAPQTENGLMLIQKRASSMSTSDNIFRGTTDNAAAASEADVGFEASDNEIDLEDGIDADAGQVALYVARQQLLLRKVISANMQAGIRPDSHRHKNMHKAHHTRIPRYEIPGLSNRNYWKLQHSKGVPWLFGAYHKTGCELIVNVMARLKNSSADDINMVGDAISQNRDSVFKPGKWDNFFFGPRLGVMSLLPDFRMVHLVRDPVSIVLSAYRFHASCPAGEPWLFDPIAKIFDIDLIIAHIHDQHPKLVGRLKTAVEQNTSLCELYNQENMPPVEGVVIEAYRSQHELELMSRNYVDTAEDPRVLQVSMDTIMEDFNGTMRCLFGFLHQSRKLHERQLMKKITEFATPTDQSHVTTGKYDNSLLEKVVSRVPHVLESKRHMDEVAHKATACNLDDDEDDEIP